jgi:hypothetical protein
MDVAFHGLEPVLYVGEGGRIYCENEGGDVFSKILVAACLEASDELKNKADGQLYRYCFPLSELKCRLSLR